MPDKYFRPSTMAEANTLLQKNNTVAVYGLNAHQFLHKNFTVIDLQELGMNSIDKEGENIALGASVTLQNLIDYEGLSDALQEAARVEERQNLRNMVTLAEIILYGDGNSPLLAALLALDAKVSVYGSSTPILLGELLALGNKPTLIEKLIITANCQLASERLARTPQDLAIVHIYLAQWSSGRIRLVVGGFGKHPTLVVDGKGSNGVELAAASACAGSADNKASSKYRSEMAKTLTLRAITSLQGK